MASFTRMLLREKTWEFRNICFAVRQYITVTYVKPSRLGSFPITPQMVLKPEWLHVGPFHVKVAWHAVTVNGQLTQLKFSHKSEWMTLRCLARNDILPHMQLLGWISLTDCTKQIRCICCPCHFRQQSTQLANRKVVHLVLGAPALVSIELLLKYWFQLSFFFFNQSVPCTMLPNHNGTWSASLDSLEAGSSMLPLEPRWCKSVCGWKWSELTNTSAVIFVWRVRKWCLFLVRLRQLLMMSLHLNKTEQERSSLVESYNSSFVWTDGSGSWYPLEPPLLKLCSLASLHLLLLLLLF